MPNIKNKETDLIAWKIITTSIPWLFNLMKEFCHSEYLCGTYKGFAKVAAYWEEKDMLLLLKEKAFYR